MARKRSAEGGDLFIDASGQLRLIGKSVEQQAMENRTVECLGLSFANDAARRSHFIEKLRGRLADPDFRKLPGVPKGSDEDILRLSDPPYYTACPNPFLADFVRVHGKSFDPTERYEREPFAVDTSVGRTDALYKAHGYHTKVPHLAIVPSILHYTKPGDLVLDGFCGSGMTGLAARWCGAAPPAYRRELEAAWSEAGRSSLEWGARRVILGDLSPAATFIASGYNLPFDVPSFDGAARRVLDKLEAELGWMYETIHTDGKTKGRINYTVWSQIYSCPECSRELSFVDEALDTETKRVAETFPCPHCKVALSKKVLERAYISQFDVALNMTVRKPKRVAALINYTVGGKAYEKRPSSHDVELLERIQNLPFPQAVPLDRMMHAPEEQQNWGDKWRAGTASFTHVHHLFLPRSAVALATLWQQVAAETDTRLRNALLFFAEQAVLGMSVLARYTPTHFSQVNQYLNGVYYVGAQIAECSPWYILDGKLSRLAKAFTPMPTTAAFAGLTTGDCAAIPIPDNSIDYVFTDPPFGANFAYAELNFVVEAWHRVFTATAREAIASPAQRKSVHDYQDLMSACFAEYHRTLKPGRWMTVVFSNSSNAIWRAIQEAIGRSGFVIGDVRTLDKKQGSFNQVHGVTVDQDLIISAYKPPTALVESFRLGTAPSESVWTFVAEHLRHVPVFVGRNNQAEVVVERTPQMLHDRMVAFHVQRGLAVPVSTREFMLGLGQRYPERDSMHFLSDQVTEYDRRRTRVSGLRQLNLFVSDEASAIQWVRQQLATKPQSFQDLQPVFMRELNGWAKHEATVELKEILQQNFLCYDGHSPVPSQIHSYLSTNFKDLRNIDKQDANLRAKAADRWYVPDANKEGDLEKLRLRTLLKEFEEYKASTSRKLKLFRTEAVRAGFKAAYDSGDYKTIVGVAAKLPETVLQEDEKLLMYFDVASMRLGDA